MENRGYKKNTLLIDWIDEIDDIIVRHEITTNVEGIGCNISAVSTLSR